MTYIWGGVGNYFTLNTIQFIFVTIRSLLFYVVGRNREIMNKLKISTTFIIVRLISFFIRNEIKQSKNILAS